MKSKVDDFNDKNLIKYDEDYIEWTIQNLKILSNEEQLLESCNFKIGNTLWYIN